MLGLQLVWSTEMAYASPYLLSLGTSGLLSPCDVKPAYAMYTLRMLLRVHIDALAGLSKAGMSAVFLAGPLSGAYSALWTLQHDS